MRQPAGLFATPWFHRRFTLRPDGQYVTVTEVSEWARGPYDDLLRNLLLQNGNRAHAPRVLLVTAARHGDGNTTTAVMLAARLASSAPCVLLDLNFRRPGVASAVGLSEYTPLGELLNGTAAGVERAAVPTEVANLFALPNQVNGGGRRLPELDGLADAVRRLREQYHFVVIDAAPVIGYPDTPLIASLADGVLLVVAADATPARLGVAARQELERAGATVLGAVVTRQRRFVPEFLARRFPGT